jgi:hypothetical protein
MRLESREVGAVKCLDGRILDGAVHPLCLTIDPRVVGLGQAVLDAVPPADSVEGVPAGQSGPAAAVLRLVGEGNAVVGEHGVDLVRECRESAPEKACAGCHGGAVVELDKGELRHPMDGQEQMELGHGEA